MKHYMSEKNSIIVLLHSANYDIATSLSLKLAFTVDPQQERTIVCLNKIDLMDRGTDALSILKGE